jgi:hypothetical protein
MKSKLYRVVMKNGHQLTVCAPNGVRAEELAFHQYHLAVGKWVGVETVELAEGYDIA